MQVYIAPQFITVTSITGDRKIDINISQIILIEDCYFNNMSCTRIRMMGHDEWVRVNENVQQIRDRIYDVTQGNMGNMPR